MNKQEVNKLIDRLASKEILFGIHRVDIGDVLEKIDRGNELLDYWLACGYSKSLQEIRDESGWICKTCNSTPDEFDRCCSVILPQLKDSKARQLFDFLNNLTIQK